MTNTDPKLIPQDEAKRIAHTLSYDVAAHALDLLAETLMQTTVGSGCEQTRRGAEAMRRRVVELARGMAERWRATAAAQGPGLPA